MLAGSLGGACFPHYMRVCAAVVLLVGSRFLRCLLLQALAAFAACAAVLNMVYQLPSWGGSATFGQPTANPDTATSIEAVFGLERCVGARRVMSVAGMAVAHVDGLVLCGLAGGLPHTALPAQCSHTRMCASLRWHQWS